MRPLPNATIEIEPLRNWLLAGPGAGDPSATVDADLARALAAGIPAAWALYQDVVKPRLIGAAFPLCGDSKLAVELSDAVSARLYVGRDDALASGLPDLPPDISLFQLCRALLLRELVERHSDDGDARAHDSTPAIELARELCDPKQTQRAPTGSRTALPTELKSALRQLEERIPIELRSLDLPDQLVRQRRSSRELARNVRILNLPAVLMLVFFVTLGAAGAYIASSPKSGSDNREHDRIRGLVSARNFDEALRQLSVDPPIGCEGLAPLRPESRGQRLRDLRTRAPQRPLVAILFPHGRIDSARPKIAIDRDPCFPDPIQLRLVDSSTGQTVLQRKVPPQELVIDPGAVLTRGNAYVVSIEGPSVATRSQFEILTEAESVEVETRIGDVLSRFQQPDPVLQAFLRAHVYRSEGCFEASLEEWRRLGTLVPDRSYPREEAACLIDSEFRMAWHAFAELSRRP